MLAGTPFAPGLQGVSLFASEPPIRARLAPGPSPAEMLAQSVAPVAPRGQADTPASGLPAPEIFYRGREVDKRAETTNEVTIEYPQHALAERMAGTVTLRLKIDHRGLLREVQVLEAQPPRIFEEAALNAVRALKFTPAIRNGVPVGSIKTIEVPFDPKCVRMGGCVPDAEQGAPGR